jgi:hypothetical protein
MQYGPQPDRPWTAALRKTIAAATAAGLSYRALEAQCGVSYAELHRVMTKHRAGTRLTAERIAGAVAALAKSQAAAAARCEREAIALKSALKAGERE